MQRLPAVFIMILIDSQLYSLQTNLNFLISLFNRPLIKIGVLKTSDTVLLYNKLL